jgi:uncharacterized protein (TIGR02001 family)
MKTRAAACVKGLTLLLSIVATQTAFAQTTTAPSAASETETPPAPPAAPAPGLAITPDLTLTGNAGLFSDYRFRGFTQTGYKPAFQGGFDLSHSSGFYIGNWNSNVEQGLYRGASLEMDFYGGYKYTFLEDYTLDVGGYYYYYPTKHTSGGGYGGYDKKAAEGEVYVGLSWKTLSVKYWYGVTNYFGLGDSFQGSQKIDTKGSGYVEGNGTYDLGDGWGLVGHVGYQYVKNNSQFVDVNGNTLSHSVIDYKVGGTKDFSGWVVGLAVVGTTKKSYFGTATSLEAGGKVRPLASVSKTF